MSALHGPILLAPWHQRGNAGDRWLVGTLVALGLLAPLGLLVAGARVPALETLLVFGLILLASAWATLVSSVLEQNGPAAARLVPGHPHALRIALWAGAVATLVLAAAMVIAMFAGVVLAEPAAVPAPLSAYITHLSLATLSIVALVVTGVAAGVRWPTLGFAALVVPLPSALDDGHVALRVASALAQAWGTSPAIATVLLVLGMLALLGGLVQDGGSRHAARYARRQAQRERFRLRASGQLAPEAMVVATSRGWRWPSAARMAYGAWFDHVIARGGSIDTRLFLALGPGSHWSARVASLASAGVYLAIFLGAMAVLGGMDLLRGTWFGLATGAVMTPAAYLLQLRARFHPTRREQALLVLLPGVPRGAALNRAIALRLGGGFLIASAAGLAVAWLLMRLEPSAMSHRTDGWLAAAAIAVFPALSGAFARLDRLRAPSPVAAVAPVVRLALQAAVVAALWRWLGLPLPVVAALVCGATLAWCAWRWQRRAQEPSAFPVRG